MNASNTESTGANPLAGKRIALGITGGIAAYKSPLLIRLLKKAGADVRVLATANALQFTTKWTIETLSENPLETEMFPADSTGGTHHITTAEWADLFVIAPATANIIGKISSGISDDNLTSTLCAFSGPVMLAPAMNTNMYENPVTKKNLNYLRSIGYTIIDPESGELACNTVGVGRMAEPEEIFARIFQFFANNVTTPRNVSSQPSQISGSLAGKRVIVTAGPCREPIDPVRYISNRSSGRMGYELARAAQSAGADVTLISGPTDLTPPPNVALIRVETTAQMRDAVIDAIGNADILLMAAAPADFAPAVESRTKIKKAGHGLSLDLAPTPDILHEVSAKKFKSLYVVGFALETDNLLVNAEDKLRSKKLDLIVANPATEKGSGPDSPTNRATLVFADGSSRELDLLPKEKLAEIIIGEVTAALSHRDSKKHEAQPNVSQKN